MNSLLKKKISIYSALAIYLLGSSSVYANSWETDIPNNIVFIQKGPNEYSFNPKNPTVIKEGYYKLYGDKLFHEVVYGDKVPVKVFLPTEVPKSINKYTSGNAGALMKKYVKANTKNVAGKGGEHLISANDWNSKKGQVVDPISSSGYKGDNTGFIDINGYKGELRYLGYLDDGSQVDNPYFPNDITNNKKPWDKDWKHFGVSTYSGKKHEPTEYNRTPAIAKEVFTAFINHTEFGQQMAKKDPKWKDWQTWNKYFSIQQSNEPDSLAFQITGFYEQDYIRYQTFTMTRPIPASTYIMNMQLSEAENPDALVSRVRIMEMETSSGRSLGDPLYQGLRSYIAQQENFKRSSNLPELKHNGDYAVSGKVKYYHRDNEQIGTQLENWKVKYTFNWTNAETGAKAKTEALADFTSPLLSSRTVGNQGSDTNPVKIVWPTNMVPTDLTITMELPAALLETQAGKKYADDVIADDNMAAMQFKISPPQDMAIPDLELLKDNKVTSYPTPNQEHEVLVQVENLGNDPVTDPTIDVVIKDKNDKPFFQETVTLPGILEPGQKVPVPVKPVIPPTSEIEVCAVINKGHTDNKQNIANANDKRCETFKTVHDIGVSSDVILKDSTGNIVTEYASGENHTVVFKPKHVVGPEAIGLDPITNPKATIDVEIKDQKGNVIVKNTLTAGQILNPQGMVEIEVPHVKATTEEITACAIINKKHTNLEYNIENENDKACKTWSAVKNYSMKELTVNPPRVYSPGPAVKQPLTFTYTLANESKGSATDNPLVVLKKDGQEIWKDNVAIKRGDVITKKIEIPQSQSIISKDHVFTIEVNPNKTEKEMKPNADAYADNKKSTSIDFVVYDADRGCIVNKTTVNKWKEDIKFVRHYDMWEFQYECHHYSYDSDGDRYHSGCHDVYECEEYSKTVTVPTDYSESYNITKIEARSKWSKDNAKKYNHINNDGWADVTNGGVFKVKAGYPVEIRVTSQYKTNRNKLPATPSEIWNPKAHHELGLDIFSEVDGTAVNQATYIKVTDTKNGTKYTNGEFVQMVGGASGNWYDSTAVRTMPSRSSISDKGEPVKGFYTTKPGMIKVDIITNEHSGVAKPQYTSGTLKTLQDCKSFNIEVLPNNDLGSHITD